MEKKHRELTNGGYFDVYAATILWAQRGFVWRFKPSGRFNGGEMSFYVLYLTPNGNYVIQDHQGPLSMRGGGTTNR